MKKTMLQQVMTSPGVIEFRDVPLVGPGKNQVLIKIMKIGICGSDIHVFHGLHPFTKYPVTQGHEVSGEVVGLGDGVEELKLGDKVTIQPQVVCGKCHPCRHGKYNLCEELKVMGFQTTGMASEFFVADTFRVTRLPDDMTYDEGSMIEPLAVGVHAVRKAGQVKGLKIAVLGAGPIGILVAMAAKGMGAESVLITDVSDLRLKKAKEVGVDYTANTRKKDFAEVLVESFGPDKADIIYDCAGNNVTMGQAIKYARKGSKIILVAVFSGLAEIDLAVLNDHELELNSSMMYVNEDYLEAIDLVKTGKVKLAPLITKNFPFKDFQKAYKYIEENQEKTMKVVIDVQE